MNAPRSFWMLGGLAAAVYTLGKVGPLGWFLLFWLCIVALYFWPLWLAGAVAYAGYRGLRRLLHPWPWRWHRV